MNVDESALRALIEQIQALPRYWHIIGRSQGSELVVLADVLAILRNADPKHP